MEKFEKIRSEWLTKLIASLFEKEWKKQIEFHKYTE